MLFEDTMPREFSLSPTKILSQLEKLYRTAVKQDNILLAVKIKELQGRALGVFQPINAVNRVLPPASLSDIKLNQVIEGLENHAKLSSADPYSEV